MVVTVTITAAAKQSIIYQRNGDKECGGEEKGVEREREEDRVNGWYRIENKNKQINKQP